MELKSKIEYACLFGGGAMRGTAHVGVLKALEELNILINTIAGSSVGAIVAALLAVGYTSAELRDVFLKVNFELFRDIHFGFGEKFAISKGEVFLEWIRELIEKKYYGENYSKGENKPVTFKDLKKNLVIITTDLSHFKCKEFSQVKTPDFEVAYAVRISSSMPGLMKPLEYNNVLLVDGDLQKSWPMWRLTETLNNQSGRILEVRLEGDCSGNDMNAINYANTVYSCITSIATDYVLDRYSGNDKYDFIIINTGDMIILDFNQAKEKREYLMELGYKQTIKYFREYLPKKKDHLFEIYDRIYSMFNSFNKALCGSNVIKAKTILGEIFIYFADHAQFMDAGDLDEIYRLKDDFLANIKYPALFGRTSLKNSKEILSETETIIEMIKEKLIDLKNYQILLKNNNIDN